MKRQSVFLIVMFLICGVAQAQQRSPEPATAPPGARGGGARGTPAANSEVEARLQELQNNLRELERFISRANGPVVINAITGAWWNNTALVTQLGLTTDQKAKIEKAFESQRLNLETSKAQLEREESQLARLLEADSLDRNAAQAQIYKVVNARSEMERINSTMTLEMREQMTRAQWLQLQAQSNATLRINAPNAVRSTRDTLNPPRE